MPKAWFRFAVGLAIGVGAVYAIVTSAGGFAESLDALADTRPVWLIPAIAAEAVSYLFLGLLLRRLAGARARVSKSTAVRLGLVLSGLGNVLPAAPAEGLAMVSAELRRRGVSARRVHLTLVFSEWYTTRVAFGVAALNALIFVVLADRYRVRHFGDLRLIAAPAAGVLLVLALSGWLLSRQATAEGVSALIGRLRFWGPPVPSAERRAAGAAWHQAAKRMLGPPRKQAGTIALAFFCLVGDLACFWCSLVAAGVKPGSGVLLLAYGAGMFASLVPLLPDGFGAVEAVVPAILRRAGTPLAIGLAGMLVYRAVGTVLPAAGGTISLAHLHFGRRSRHVEH